MGETVKEATSQSLTKQLSEFVSWRIQWLSSMTRESQVKATLANLRRGVGKTPGELPELWGTLFQNFPKALNEKASEIEPSKAEWAAYLSLTLYALHQQGHDIEKENMQRDGVGLGTAVRRLVPEGEAEENSSIFSRFQTLATSSDIKELAHHLRGIIQLLNQGKIGLDYVKLSEDLYRYQFEDSRNGVRLKWGRQYFGGIKKEENEEDKLDISQEFKPMTAEDNVSVFEGESSYATKPVYKYIGIAFNTYIIIEMKSDLYIIDQHAAHERIMYEKIKQNYYNNDTKDSQLMLLPDIITLTHKEMGIYRDNKELFQRAGFMVEEFGENTVKLSGVPDVLLDLETKELFLETLDEINTVARTAKQEIEEKFIATVACKAAVKAHMVLERQEVIQLLDKLLQLPNPFTCPHGRPTAIKMTRNDIEKKFSRR